jgi:hypothetical protein
MFMRWCDLNIISMKPHKTVRNAFGKGKLPKFIRDNIKHPVLRQAWLIELGAASQRLYPKHQV